MTVAHVFPLREAQVLEAAARGLTVVETGRELFLSVDTVKTYRRRVLRRVGALNMTQAVAVWTASRHGERR